MEVRLPYVQRFVDRHGRVRYYFRRPGFERTPLPGSPGSPEFMAAYLQAQTVRRVVARKDPGTISSLIAAYYESSQFLGLGASTRYVYRNILERFREAHGDKPAAELQARHLQAILDQLYRDAPASASNMLKRLRAVFKHALKQGLVERDPTVSLEIRKPKSDGFRAWTDNDIERFRRYHSGDKKLILALNLLLYTGQRRSDVARMSWRDVTDGFLYVRQQKVAIELQIPIHPVLMASIEPLPRDAPAFVLTRSGQPYTKESFSAWFVDGCREAGLPEGCTPHGLRKAAGRMLAEAGCSAHEIAAITGHTTLKEVERYTKTARQKGLAQSAISRLKKV